MQLCKSQMFKDFMFLSMQGKEIIKLFTFSNIKMLQFHYRIVFFFQIWIKNLSFWL